MQVNRQIRKCFLYIFVSDRPLSVLGDLLLYYPPIVADNLISLLYKVYIVSMFESSIDVNSGLLEVLFRISFIHDAAIEKLSIRTLKQKYS